VRHALWLIPAEPVRGRCAASIDMLAREFGTPSFAPHVTLLQGIRRDADDVVAAARELACALPPLAVTLGALGEAPEYYRALFVEVTGPDLDAARRRAAAALAIPPDADFDPHLSLLYGQLSSVTKASIMSRIDRALEGAATLDRLDVVDTEGRPEAWITRASLALGAG
jgi:2'-5' RNA ligase